jgi:hypothetical protein
MSSTDKEDVLEILTNIETLEDLEENKNVIIDLVINELRVGIDALKTLTDGTVSPDELETRMTSIEGGREKLELGIDAELERIAKIPGAEEVVLSLRGELTNRMGDLAQEMAMAMGQLMGNLMGGMFGEEDLGAELSQMAGELEFSEEDLENFELPEGVVNDAINYIRSLKTTEEMQEKQEEVLKILEGMFRSELESAQDINEADLSPEEIKDHVMELQKRQMYIISEMEKEFTRLNANPGSEFGDIMEERMTELVEPIMTKYFGIIDELGEKYRASLPEGNTDEND